jgi:IPT/TIG domain-containing protein
MDVEGIQMIKSSLTIAVLAALAAALVLCAQSSLPQMQTVDPSSAKTGDVVTVTGENLGPAIVATLFLTDGKADIKVEMTQQTDTAIKFKIPASMKTGRFALMVLTKGKDAKLIEEPVKVLIEPPLVPPTGD